MGPWYDIALFFHGHSQCSESEPLSRRTRAACSEEELRSVDGWRAKCGDLITETDTDTETGGWFPHDIENTCLGLESSVKAQLTKGAGGDPHGINRALRHRRQTGKLVSGKSTLPMLSSPGAGGVQVGHGKYPPIVPGQGHSGGGAACSGNALDEWLLRNETLDAIGVSRDANFVNLDNGHGFNYTGDQPQVTFIYKKMIDAGKQILIYEGDTDACGLQTQPVEDVFTHYFNEVINITQTQPWRPFTLDGQQMMGGYSMVWLDGQVRFASIRGAGHLVPINRPITSAVLMEAFLQGEQLQPFVKPARKSEL